MKHLWRKLVSVILALAMVVLCLPEYVSPVKKALANSGDPVIYYMDETGETQSISGSQYTRITNNVNSEQPTTLGVSGRTTYYVVGLNLNNNQTTLSYNQNRGRVVVKGDVRLIILDNITFEIPRGIQVSANDSLTVYGNASRNQSASVRAVGALKCNLASNSNTNNGRAAIGGNNGDSAGTIKFVDCAITATGGNHGAAIGGGNGGNGGSILVYGSRTTISATAGAGAAGIGGGVDGNGGNITINAGTVTATGGQSSENDYIYGGAGIGGGDGGNGGTIVIKGGTVDATGKYGGAGIGGGLNNYGGSITISGGTVSATGGSYNSNITPLGGAGIGGGSNPSGTYTTTSQVITISGGTVKATSPSQQQTAAIGGGRGQTHGGTITITDGNVTATGANSRYTVGIGSYSGGADVHISGGTVVATSNSNNYGYGIYAASIEIGITDAEASVTAKNYNISGNGYNKHITFNTSVKISETGTTIPSGSYSSYNFSNIAGKKLVKGANLIKFVNYDGTLLKSYSLNLGAMPMYDGPAPKRDASVTTEYTFHKWSPDLVAVTGDATYTAMYKETPRKYFVTFYDENGTTVLYENNFAYGSNPVFGGENEPTKGDATGYTYTFIGWEAQNGTFYAKNDTLPAVAGEASYKAKYQENAKEFTITFVNFDGDELASYTVPYGQKPVYDGATPEQEKSDKYTYTFSGWKDLNNVTFGKDGELPNVSGDMTYTAVFTDTINKYSVKFVDENGEEIKGEILYDYDTPAEDIAKPDDPFKDADDDCVYTFAGWNPVITKVTENVVYTATYSMTAREYYNTTINVSWDDEGDQDGIRPESVTAIFYASDVKVAEVIISENDNWSKQLRLPVNDVKGNAISYLFMQKSVSNYDTAFESSKENGNYTISVSNTHTPATVSLTVRKNWEDFENEFGTRPGSLTVSLMSGSQVVTTVELNANDNWTATVTGIAKYRNHGTEIEYSWTESEVTGYRMTGNETTENVTTITNALITDTISGQVTWNMNGYSPDLIPESVTVKILDGDRVVEVIPVNCVDGSYTWQFKSGDLPKFASDGTEIKYTVDEEPVSGFEKNVAGTSITNTYVPVMTRIKGNIKWDLKGNDVALIPDVVYVEILDGEDVVATLEVADFNYEGCQFESDELPKYREDGVTEIVYEIRSTVDGFNTTVVGTTITYTLQTVTVSGTISWEMYGYDESLIPDSVEVRIKLENDTQIIEAITVSAGEDWEFDSRELPKYAEDGKTELVYVVDEVVPTGFRAEITGTGIVNHYVPQLTNVTGKVNWELKNNNEELRPESVTVYLYDGEDEVSSIAVSNESGWTFEFSDLPQYRTDGTTVIVYSVVAQEIDGFTAGVSGTNITYTLDTVDVSVNIVWDDLGNNDGYRPSEVKVNLMAGTKNVGAVTLNESNSWSHIWTNLPRMVGETELAYTVTEGEIDKYSTDIDQDEDDELAFTITNTHEKEKVKFSIILTWDDNENQDGYRPYGISVNLVKAGETEFPIDCLALDSYQKWTVTKTGLDRWFAGEAIDYAPEFVDDLSPDYELELDFDVDDETGDITYHATYKHTPEKVNLKVVKVWDDGDNQDGCRPDSVTMTLYAKVEGAEVKESVETVELSSETSWEYSWTNLDKRSAGQVILYSVEEEEVAEYATQYDESIVEDVTVFTVTNYHTTYKTSVSVEKIWDDTNNKEGFRPGSVVIELQKGNEVIDSVVLNEKNHWQHTWAGLAKNDNGNPIEYTVTENQVDGYKTPVIAKISETEWEYTVTNSRDYEETAVKVNVVWSDEDNIEGFRPASVTINLMKGTENLGSVVLDSTNNWSYTWDKLQKYENGEPIQYSVTEETVADYQTSIAQATDGSFTYQVTNSRTVEKTEATAVILWEDNSNTEGFRPDSVTVNLLANGKKVKEATLEKDGWSYTWTDLQKFADAKEIEYTVEQAQLPNYNAPAVDRASETEWLYTVTNERDYEETEVEVTVAWSDTSNKEGFRPENVTVRLMVGDEEVGNALLNEANQWSYTWEKLQKYADGKAIDYTVTEDAVANYSSKITKATDGTFTYTVTNSRELVMTLVDVSIAWKDSDNTEGFRPDEVTVKLLANGAEVGEDGVVTLSAEDNWRYTFIQLQKYADAREIVYTVSEVQPENYVVESIDKIDEDVWAYLITNTRELVTTSAEVKVTWEDKSNQDGYRPETLTVTLLANGEATGQTLVVLATDEWTGRIDGLQKYSDKKEIKYTFTVATNPDKYTFGEASTVDSVTTISLSHETEETDVSVKKVWDDANNQDGYRPDDVTINLLADGAVIDTITLSAENSWSYSWTKLDKKAAGKEIDYTVTENAVSEYTTKITKAADGTFTYTLTNSHKTEETEVKVKKVWDDANNQDGYRPDDVTVNLLADGDVIDTIKLSEENNWSYIWTKLDKKAGGENIDYTVTEDEVSEYTTEITKAADGTFTYTVTNSHKTEETEVEVKKVWDDADDQDGYRPDDVTVNLLADGEVIDTIKLNEENNWSYTWTKLDKKAAGKVIDYTVTEDKVSKYETEIVKASDAVIGGVVDGTSDGIVTNQYNNGEVTEGTDDGTFSYIIMNSHTPETISPIVKVVWVDEDDRNGKRPESVDSVLVNDEEESKGTVTLGLETEWTETAKEPVAKYKNGGTPVKYTWTITSELPAGYEVVDTAEDGLTTTITIAYIAKPVKLPLEVVKVLTGREWNEKDAFEFTLAADAENPEGAELPEVTVVNATAETKTVAFDEIVFSKRGTYKFTITETKGTLDGVSYDTVAKEFVVVVEDDGVGSLYIDEVTNKGSVEITNVYSSVGAIQFAAKKVLDGRELKDGEFTFVLKNEAGEVLQTATCDKDGKISFEPIAYIEKDMVVDGKIVATREYTYTISEVKPEGEKYDALIVYDESVKIIKVTLTDNQDGTITTDAKTTDANITFTNVKLAEYEITFVDEDGTTVLKDARKYVVGTKAADVEKPVDPTKKEDDSFTYEFSGWTPEISDVAGDVTYKATYKATAKPGVYYLVGDAPSAKKGDGEGLTMQFKRTVNDAITFDQFNGLSFNGKELSKDQYTATKGSVIIKVPQELINSLPDGKNEVTVTFKDGDPVKVSVEILPASQSETDPTDPTEPDDGKKDSPKTADTLVYGWMIVLLGISGVTALLVIKRRKEEEEQIGL